MKKNRMRLTESQLHRVIKESVKRVLREWDDPNDEYYRTEGRNFIDDVYNINAVVAKALESIENKEITGGYMDTLYHYCQNFVDDYAQFAN